jgi:hypothetical protein
LGDILATPEVLFKAHGGVLFPVGWAGTRVLAHQDPGLDLRLETKPPTEAGARAGVGEGQRGRGVSIDL